MTENILEGVALVTGAGSGIARALALQLGAAGAVVAVADVNKKNVVKTADDIISAGGASAPFAFDVADPQAVDDAVNTIERDLGPVSRLANVAGIFATAALADISDDQWAEMLSVHVNGTFYLCRRIVPTMVSRRRGAVVNTSSIFALRGQSEASHYAAAKGAIIGFSKSIAREVGDANVRVNVVAPGPVDTPFFARGMSGDELARVREERARVIPLGKIGRPEEVASIMFFFLGEGSNHMTGQVIPVDGGEMMR
tara:strand:- start:133 stop:897 length:765 start_codon:yes stop_codon:yes gene_type:complete